MSDDVRPFFGEEASVVGEQLEPWVAKPSDSRTPAEWRELKIAQGECPYVGCNGDLDDSLFCSACGNVSLPKPREVVLEDLPGYVPRIPGGADEFAPAQIDDWEAA